MTDVAHKPPTHLPLNAEPHQTARGEQRSADQKSLPYHNQSASTLWLSIVIPTRNESGNIEPLLSRLASITTAPNVEVVFVDDSSDDTPTIISHAGDHYHCPVRMIHREPENREGGLGSAVLEGIRAARGEWIVVMDGDLQHPPETIPALLNAAENNNYDLVVASTF